LGSIIIDFKKLPGETERATEFLRSKVEGRLSQKGYQIVVEQGQHKKLKLLIRRFLHQRGLENYRLIPQPDGFEILEPKHERPHQDVDERPRGAGISPYSPYRMNPTTSVEFPNYPPVTPRKFRNPKR
jgi:hypothetical protein